MNAEQARFVETVKVSIGLMTDEQVATVAECFSEMRDAVLAYDALERQRDQCENCADCLERAPEACGECFPFADDLRIKMRAALAKVKGGKN